MKLNFDLRAAFPALLFYLFVAASGATAQTGVAPTCVSLTGTAPLTVVENFDALANAATSSVVPAGFGFVETGTAANTTYAAGTGSDAAGNTYSFGAASSAERAFGSLRSGSLTSIIGACFTNNTNTQLNSFRINYNGEQWRLGTAGRADRLDFQYTVSPTANSLTVLGAATGYTDVDALDFSSPSTTGTAGARDGNTAGFRTENIASRIFVTIPVGQTLYVRFADFDASGADDGLAIDDFTFVGSVATAASVAIGGRVLDANGRAVSRAQIVLIDQDGNRRQTRANAFGNFRFDNVAAGASYTLAVIHKELQFEPQFVTPSDNLENLVLIEQQSAQPSNGRLRKQ